MSADSSSLDRITAEAAEWFTAIRADELSPAERQRFVNWLEASPLHVQEYLGVAETWGTLSAANAWPTRTPEELIAAARSTSNVVMLASAPLARQEEEKKTSARRIMPIGVAIAAAVLLAVIGLSLIDTTIFDLWHRGVYVTARGEQRSIVLDDGSVIQLNTLSRIAVHFTEQERRIELTEGEAFFRVARDPGRPFDVVTPVATVRAVGTEFNVYSRDARVRVAVVDGRVQVSPRSTAADPASPEKAPHGYAGASAAVPLSLGAHEAIEIHSDGPLIRNSGYSPAQATAWMQRRLVFENERLDAVIAEFNRYSPHPMRVINPELARLRISGVFNADEPETLVAYLQEIQNVHVVRRGVVTVLSPDTAASGNPRGAH